MPTWTGFFDKSGSPAVKIFLYGVSHQLKKELDVVIDTGFTGFLSMPLIQAFPFGLVLLGTTNVVLADGSTVTKLTALGHVQVGTEDKVGVILLGPNDTGVLLGMDLLREFGKKLVVSAVNHTVELQDDQPAAPAVAPTPPPVPAPAAGP